MSPPPRKGFLKLIGPGILVAATGVGAGDLATGAFTGSRLGLAILWAVLIGAGLKYVLNEGLARWQLVTGETLLEGAVSRFGRWMAWPFLFYLLIWSFTVGAALMSACGVTAHAILPLRSVAEVCGIAPDTAANTFPAATDKIIYGILHSAVAVVLIWRGGYRLFERVMSVCIAIMFCTVISTAIATSPPWSRVVSGMFVPTIPPGTGGDGLQWTIALMGGVGGTLTVLCYGYWIREEQRHDTDDIRTCRIDLFTGYLMTAIFGLGVVIIGSQVSVEGGGAKLIVQLADALEAPLGTVGPAARWAFLIGGWGAVFSSLLGVWQSVPYLFADFCSLNARGPAAGSPATGDVSGSRDDRSVDTNSTAYRGYLIGLALIPVAGLWQQFITIQKIYAIIGAAFIPLLAIVLLALNGHSRWIGSQYRNRWWTNGLLLITLIFFIVAGWMEAAKKL